MRLNPTKLKSGLFIFSPFPQWGLFKPEFMRKLTGNPCPPSHPGKCAWLGDLRDQLYNKVPNLKIQGRLGSSLVYYKLPLMGPQGSAWFSLILRGHGGTSNYFGMFCQKLVGMDASWRQSFFSSKVQKVGTPKRWWTFLILNFQLAFVWIANIWNAG